MENASRALLMAGGILIGILVATFMMVMLGKGGSLNAEYNSQADNELVKFNSKFEIYDRPDNTFFDIITACNLAYDINKKNGYDAQNSVQVTVVIDEGGQKGEYVLVPDANLEKNYFMKDGDPVYIYDLVQEYTENKQVAGDRQYKYVFECKGVDDISRIEYSSITGKVESIRFEIVENY